MKKIKDIKKIIKKYENEINDFIDRGEYVLGAYNFKENAFEFYATENEIGKIVVYSTKEGLKVGKIVDIDFEEANIKIKDIETGEVNFSDGSDVVDIIHLISKEKW